MMENPCNDLLEEWENARLEYINFSQGGRIGNVQDLTENIDIEPTQIQNQEEWERIKKRNQKEIELKNKMKKAKKAYENCLKENGLME